MSVEGRSLHPGTPAQPLVAERREAGMPTPLVGMLLFIASEVMFFGGLFAAYFNSRATHQGPWGPPHPAPELEIFPIALPITIILVSSSLTMQFGVWAIRRGDIGKLKLWTAVTLLLGVVFLIGQLYDYSQLGFGISDGIFGTTFYTLTGFHGLHVTLGLLMLLALAITAFAGGIGPRSSPGRHTAVGAVSIYWHFVDALWAVILTVVYLWNLL